MSDITLSEADAKRIATMVAAQIRPVLVTELFTRDELARALRVSPQTVDRRVREGMPVEYIGDLPRFDFAACREWFAANSSKRPARPASEEPLHVTMRTRRK